MLNLTPDEIRLLLDALDAYADIAYDPILRRKFSEALRAMEEESEIEMTRRLG